METKYKHLFSPLKINSLMVSNRIMSSPMGLPTGTNISSTDYGGVSVLDRSTGGAGVVTVNYMALAGIGHFTSPFEKYARDSSREALSVMKQAGAKANIQIFFHPIRRKDGTLEMPSDGDSFREPGDPARAMTREEIQAHIDTLVQQCLEAKEFGFDMIMLHFAHDSLTSLFLSPVWNKRTDEYGGSLENRIRITKEAAHAVRKAVGPDYPLMIRISRNLWVKETYSEDDMVALIQTIQEDIDIVNVSMSMDCYGGTIDKYDANVHMSTMHFEPHLYNAEFGARLKKECDVLVCPIGAIMSPDEAEALIAEEKADAVMMARALVADPYWPKKAMENRAEDIVPCLRCGHCYHISTVHNNVVCSVNPRFRRENRVPLKLEKAEKKKRVVIIGGGPAGCKAALTASERGHQVILLEKSDRLGGQINVADYDDYKQDLKRYRDYLVAQINKHTEIEVHYQTLADYDVVSALNPDAILIAVGAEPVTPRIKGIEYAQQALDIYPHLEEIKGKIVVIGGGTIGSELSLELAERHNDVTVVELGDTLAAKGNWLYRLALYQHMDSCETLCKQVKTTVEEIRKNEVVVRDKNNNTSVLSADHIILAVGMKPCRELAHSFYGITPQTFMIGDCNNVAKVIEATNEGYFIAANL